MVATCLAATACEVHRKAGPWRCTFTLADHRGRLGWVALISVLLPGGDEMCEVPWARA